MAPDQLHEQNNEVIKSVRGATYVLNREDQVGFERWGLCISELGCIVSEYHISSKTNISMNTKHEDTPAFQKHFSCDVVNVVKNMTLNPFEENTLVRIDNTTISFDDKVIIHSKKLLGKCQVQAQLFLDERLVKETVAVNAPVRKNNFCEQTLTYSNAVLTKLRSAFEIRPQITSRVFDSELFRVAQSLARTSNNIYYGTKSVLADKFESSEYISVNPVDPSALVIELSPLIRTHSVKVGMTFSEFAQSLFQRILSLARGYYRCDVIADRYFGQSLKENLRSKRGIGSRFVFKSSTLVPSDIRENFLMNSANKHPLSHYLAERFTDFHSNDSIPILVCTYGDSVLTNSPSLQLPDDITHCISEEADQRIVRLAINCYKNGFTRVDVLTIDTDVLILVLASYPLLKAINPSISILCETGLGASIKDYDVLKLANEFGDQVCKALPFFSALTGCDTV